LRQADTCSELLRSSVGSANSASDAAQDLHALLAAIQSESAEQRGFPRALTRKLEESQRLTMCVLDRCLQTAAASERLREVECRRALERCLLGCRLALLSRAFAIFRDGCSVRGDFRSVPRALWASLHARFSQSASRRAGDFRSAPSWAHARFEHAKVLMSERTNECEDRRASGTVDGAAALPSGRGAVAKVGDWRSAPMCFWSRLHNRFPIAASTGDSLDAWQPVAYSIDKGFFARWDRLRQSNAAVPSKNLFCFCAGQRPGKMAKADIAVLSVAA